MFVNHKKNPSPQHVKPGETVPKNDPTVSRGSVEMSSKDPALTIWDAVLPKSVVSVEPVPNMILKSVTLMTTAKAILPVYASIKSVNFLGNQ